MEKEIEFNKYKTRGADYHYRQINKKKIFDFNSFVYARYSIHVQMIADHIEKNLNEKDKIKILDVGCGDAVLLYMLKKKIKNKKFKIFGVDLSKIALDVAREKVPDGEFIESDVYSYNLQDNFFDIVISSDVIEHVNHPERMLTEIKRVLKPAGFLVIGTPIRYTEKPLDTNHFQEFYQEEFVSLVSEYFSETKIHESHNTFHTLLYTKPFKIFKWNFLLLRYFYNILNIVFGINFFSKKRNNKNQLFSYMFVSAIKK